MRRVRIARVLRQAAFDQGPGLFQPPGFTGGEGMHRIEVKKAGFWPYETFVDSAGTRAALTVKLLPQ